jgi:hypothetical protein
MDAMIGQSPGRCQVITGARSSLSPPDFDRACAARVDAAKGRKGALTGIESTGAASGASVHPRHSQTRSAGSANGDDGPTRPAPVVGGADSKNRKVIAGIDAAATERQSVVRLSVVGERKAGRRGIRRAEFSDKSRFRGLDVRTQPSSDRRLLDKASAAGAECDEGRRDRRLS